MHTDTRKILRTGALITLTGAGAVLLLFTLFGGVTHQGPHTNSGWLALLLALGCIPTGVLTLALGLAKLAGDLRG